MLYLFDIDGTLLWTGGAGGRAIDTVFARRYQLTRAMSRIDAGGKTDPLIVEEIFLTRLRRRPTAGEIDKIIADYERELRAELARATSFRLLPGAAEILEHLGGLDGVQLGIATGNTRNGARAKLEHAGLWHHFSFGGFGCDSRDRHVLVATAIERAESAAGRPWPRTSIVVVGDTVRDIEAARACGVRVVAVATGRPSRAELEAAGPDATLDGLAELVDWHRDNAPPR